MPQWTPGRRAALLAGEVGGRRDGGEEDAALLDRHALDRQRPCRGRHVDDRIDILVVVPFGGNLHREVGLRLHVGGDHHDRFVQHGAAEILGRELPGHDRALAHGGRGEAGEVGQNADLDRLFPGPRARRAERQGSRDQSCEPRDRHDASPCSHRLAARLTTNKRTPSPCPCRPRSDSRARNRGWSFSSPAPPPPPPPAASS